MEYESYILKAGKEEAKAILHRWLDSDTAILLLIDKLGPFRAGNNITYNFVTKEASFKVRKARK
jgi:hypothetical protein